MLSLNVLFFEDHPVLMFSAYYGDKVVLSHQDTPLSFILSSIDAHAGYYVFTASVCMASPLSGCQMMQHYTTGACVCNAVGCIKHQYEFCT